VVDDLFTEAVTVLRANDRQGITTAAPQLYPHQWSWDAAFNAMGIAQFDLPRAILELTNLLRGQWGNGMIPHIVFSSAEGYFPGPTRWQSPRSVHAPTEVATSGITQPPVHAIALDLITRTVKKDDKRAWWEFLGTTFDSWFAFHKWIYTARMLEGERLVTLFHSWESGMDNSPRWDEAYQRVVVGDLEPFTRLDLDHVTDPAQRPSDEEYRKYLWIVQQLREVAYDDAAAHDVSPFAVGDVFFTAIFSFANQVLARLGRDLGRRSQVRDLEAFADAADAAVVASLDPETGLGRDRDYRRDAWVDVTPQTLGGFAPLVAGLGQLDGVVEALGGPLWSGHPDLIYPLPPTTSPEALAFSPRSYWRGPQWPVMSWFMTYVLDHHGYGDQARGFREKGLEQLRGKYYPEYIDPITNKALGSNSQSWSAAASILWLTTVV